MPGGVLKLSQFYLLKLFKLREQAQVVTQMPSFIIKTVSISLRYNGYTPVSLFVLCCQSSVQAIVNKVEKR